MNMRQWPVFEHYGIWDIDPLVEHCLLSLDGLPLVEQLRKQKVVSIERKPLLYAGGIQAHNLEDPRKGLRIVLNDINTEDEDAAVIAHELGHTFEVCFGGVFVENIYLLRFLSGDILGNETSEDFADTFAERWLAHNTNRPELIRLLRNTPPPTFV